jgi:alpha-tubulin suppressor-like RCC1 family protein
MFAITQRKMFHKIKQYSLASMMAVIPICSHGAIYPAVSAGQFHSLFLKSDKTAWSSGYNGGGQLGDGTFTNRNTPFHVLSDIVAISAGDSHSLFVRSDGTVWAVGSGDHGRLGDGSLQTKTTPVQVQILGVKDVSAGSDFSLFLKIDGTVWGCGNGSSGRLGLGQESPNPPIPVKLPIEDVVAIEAGYTQSFFLRQGGDVWATGINQGALGDGITTTSYSPKKVAESCKGFAVAGGQSGNHSLLLMLDGTTRSTGGNSWGQLGDGTRTQRYSHVEALLDGPVTSVAAGPLQSFFVKEDLTVWACGYNQVGELGVPQLGLWSSIPFQVMDKTVAVSSAEQHVLFLRADGSVWASGVNGRGAFGDGTWTDRGIPVQTIILGIILNATATSGGTVTGAGSYDLNETILVNASPSLGYLFAGWSGDLIGLENPVTLTMSNSKTIRAKFERDLTDEDEDGLTLYDEVVNHGTDPNLKDTDGDGFSDGFEVNTGFNPTASESTPDALSTIRTAVEFRFNAARDVSYRVEASTDLAEWITIETGIIGESSIVTRFYSIENKPRRYFRVRRN